MTHFNQMFYSTMILLTGVLLMTILPFWFNALIFGFATLAVLSHQIIQHMTQIKPIIAFITEFVGFCFLVCTFMGLTVGLNLILG